jgi:hypothetical protein
VDDVLLGVPAGYSRIDAVQALAREGEPALDLRVGFVERTQVSARVEDAHGVPCAKP